MPRSLDDEPDLYPPDVELVTPEDREQRNRAIIGTTLVALGCGYILERAVGHDLDFLFLSIGLGLLVGWSRVPRFALFAFGAILAGFGAQALFESLVHMRFESAIGSLLAAGGFFAVYARYPRRTAWAGAFSAVFCVIAVLDFGVGLLGLVSTSVDLMPLALVSAGVLLLSRDRLPSWFVKTGLVMAGIVFLLAATTNIGDGDSDGPRPPAAPGTSAPRPEPPSERTTTSTSSSGSEPAVAGSPPR